jgi:hypothetical protein
MYEDGSLAYDTTRKHSKRPEKINDILKRLKKGRPGNFDREARYICCEEGRSLSALYVFLLLKRFKEINRTGLYKRLYKRSLSFFKKNLFKAPTHHTPFLHILFTGFASWTLRERTWRRYFCYYQKKFLKLQRKDGSIKAWEFRANDIESMVNKKANSENELGKAYTTAIFAIIMQLPLKKIDISGKRR